MSENVDIGDVAPHEERKEQDGLRVTFQIDDDYLLAHTLSGINSSAEPEHIADIVALRNKAWEISQQAYNLVTTPESAHHLASGGTPDDLGADVTEFLTSIKATDEFRKIKSQTETYQEFVQQQWNDNFPRTAPVVQDLTGFDLDKEITVKLTHPDLANGYYVGDDTVAWGHHEDWDNYSTVYLWHESLHSYLGYSAIEHSVIQLLTDNELRTRLNQGTTYPPFEGHEELFPLMEKILPRWQQYKDHPPENGTRDIKAFIEQLREDSEIQQEAQKVTSHEDSPK